MNKGTDLISGETVIRGIGEQNRELIQWIYENYYPRVESFVRQNSGTGEEAQDLFQECMFLLFQYSRRGSRKEVENFSSYFYGMYRNRWLVHLARRKKRSESEEHAENVKDEEDDLRYLVYLKAFEKLGEDCKEVLRQYIKGISTEELASVLKTSIDYAKRKKYLCKEKLKSIAAVELKKHV